MTAFESWSLHELDHLGDSISGLLDGELGADQANAAQIHLVSCPPCAAEMLAVSQARTWVRALPPVDAPFGFYERLPASWPSSALEARPSPFGSRPSSPVFRGQPTGIERASLRRRAGLVAAGAAAAAAAAVFGVNTPRDSPASPPVARPTAAQVVTVSAGGDVLSRLTPTGVPVSFRR